MADKNRKSESKEKQNSKKPLIILAVVLVVAIAAVAVILATTGKKEEKKTVSVTPAAATTESQEDWGNRLFYNGKQYRRNPDLDTILFLGIDQESDSQWDQFTDPKDGVVGNAGRSDTIILFIVNDKDETTTMLTVSRDTITDVDVYDMKGNYKYSGPMQVTMQYAYGDSPTKSLFLSKRTINELLYNIQIDGALSLTMDGIRDITDKLGGIKLTIPKDYSYIDPRYTEGAQVTLNGEEMEHFIRYRDCSTDGSNEERTERQSWLISAVFQELKKSGAMKFIEEIIDSHPDYITSDCDAELLKKMSRYQILDEKYKVPGEVVTTDGPNEYYVDEAALQDLIVNLLYVPVEEEKGTEAETS